MRTALVLGLLAATAVTASLVAAASGAAAPTACKAGMTKYGGATARIFCGPAIATVHAGGKTFTIKQGLCLKTSGSFTLNVGELVLGVPSKPKPEYFGVTVGREAVGVGPAAGKDGVYHSGVVAVVHAGKGYALRGNATVTLKRGRSRGTFAATSLAGGTVTGSFTC
jgi:hypothetical protein